MGRGGDLVLPRGAGMGINNESPRGNGAGMGQKKLYGVGMGQKNLYGVGMGMAIPAPL